MCFDFIVGSITDMTETGTAAQGSPARSLVPMWVGGVLAFGIAIVGIIAMWSIALPLTPPGTVCAAIYPPMAGCAGDARLLPASVWSVLACGAVAVTFLLGQRGWWGAATGVILTTIIVLAGHWATMFMRVFLFA